MAIYLTIAAGTLTRLAGWLTEEADQSLLRLVIRVLYPCLIFSVVSHNEALRRPSNLLVPPLVGFGTMALGLAVAMLVTRFGRAVTGLRPGKQTRTFATCVAIYNYGFLPIPLVQALFDSPTLGVLFVQNVGAELAVWTLCLMVLTGSLDRDWWRRIFNAPSMAIVAAVAVNFLGLWELLPNFVVIALERMGDASVPMSMILIGAVIADEFQPNGQRLRRGDALKTIGWSLLLRLGLLPALFLLIAAVVPGSVELKRVLVIQAAMPAGTFPIVMARHYGGEPRVGVQVVLSTSLLSLVTIPIWIQFGLRILHLTSP